MSKLQLWAVEDAAAEVGVSRQWLNSLLRDGAYPCIEVPNRQNPEGPPRIRLLETKTVKKIKKDRQRNLEMVAEQRAAAKRKKTKKPKRGPGRPRKPRLADL